MICAVKRDFNTDLSQLYLKKETTYGFYAGFNIWDDELGELRITGAVSEQMLELSFVDKVDDYARGAVAFGMLATGSLIVALTS